MTDNSGWDKETFECWNEKITRIRALTDRMECQVRHYLRKDDVVVMSYRVINPESEWHDLRISLTLASLLDLCVKETIEAGRNLFPDITADRWISVMPRIIQDIMCGLGTISPDRIQSQIEAAIIDTCLMHAGRGYARNVKETLCGIPWKDDEPMASNE